MILSQKTNLSVARQGKNLLEMVLVVCKKVDPPLNLLQGGDFICATIYNLKCYHSNKESCPLLGGEEGVGLYYVK